MQPITVTHSASIMRPNLYRVGALLSIILLVCGIRFLPPSLIRSIAALLLLWVVPAVGWCLSLPVSMPLTERIAYGLGLAFMVNGGAALLLAFLPIRSLGIFLFVVGLLAFIPLFIAWYVVRGPQIVPSEGQNSAGRENRTLLTWRALLVIVIIALLLRVPLLGYSEFQGDEALIMRRAAQVLAGDYEQLFLHQKGPVEILTPFSLWALTGTINESLARLPFTLSGLLAVAAVALLGTRWFDARSGTFAGLLLAACGLLVAFSRIVQYQNIVVALGALSLLALTRYKQEGLLRDLLLSAAFMAYGLLAHYDAVLIVPAAAWLLGWRFVNHRGLWRHELRNMVLAILVGALVLAVFYLPFVMHPNFSRTLGYLLGARMGSGSLVYNNTGRVWLMSTFYNSIYYVIGLVVLVLLALVKRFWHPAAWLYFLVPLGFYLFLVFDPRTHIYTFYPGAAILAGHILSVVVERVKQLSPVVRYSLVSFGLAWYLLCVGYSGLVFINHNPEYKREWPDSRYALYPMTSESLPLFGFFGFPYRTGWKTVERLYVKGILTGTYASNEEPEITTWYVRSGSRTLCGRPDIYIIAENVQDPIAIDEVELAHDYVLVAEVAVEGREKLHIYQREARWTSVPVFDAALFANAFDQDTIFVNQLPSEYSGQYPVQADFGSVARLLGYDLSTDTVLGGDVLRVSFYWRALEPTQRNYQVFAHLVTGDLVAQHDGAPACAHRPTSGWEPGQIIRDDHFIHIDPSVPSGTVSLHVGMYDLITLDRLPLQGQDMTALPLQGIRIIDGGVQ